MTEKNRLLQINTIPLIQWGFMSALMTHLQIIMNKIMFKLDLNTNV